VRHQRGVVGQATRECSGSLEARGAKLCEAHTVEYFCNIPRCFAIILLMDPRSLAAAGGTTGHTSHAAHLAPCVRPCCRAVLAAKSACEDAASFANRRPRRCPTAVLWLSSAAGAVRGVAMISAVETDFVVKALQQGLRADGRSPIETRKV